MNDVQIRVYDKQIYTTHSDKGVSVKRAGAMNGTLLFDRENVRRCSYGTPYGNLVLDIKTTNIEVYLLEKGVKIYIEYTTLMDGEKISDNVFMVMAN